MSLNLNLNLKKPLVFLKVATTGMNALDKEGVQGERIVEISITKITPDRQAPQTGTRLINPGKPIPPEATKIHGITDEMVQNMPRFEEIAQALYGFIGDSDIAGFSVGFDIEFLVEEFNRAGIPFTIVNRNIVDLSSIYHELDKRDFRAAAMKFAGQNLSTDPISSETTNNIAISILNGIVSQNSGDARFQNPSPESLHNSFNRNKRFMDVHRKIRLNDQGRPEFNFGKYKGKLIAEIMKVDYNYCDWCINGSDLPRDAKYLIQGIVTSAQKNQSTQNA
jgi:DNA polymerase-3 subunit epsilon